MNNTHAKAIIKLLKQNDIRVAYNDKLKTGGRSLKIYNPGGEGQQSLRIKKVKKLLAKYNLVTQIIKSDKKNVTVKNWTGNPWDGVGVIRIHVK